MLSAESKTSSELGPRDRCLLIDGHAGAYRAFYAIRRLNSPSGEPTNAIFGFVKAVMRLVERFSPSHLVVVWDGGLAEERTQVLPDYKANRPPMPEALAQQLDGIAEWIRAQGWHSFVRDGVEADDWIAGLAESAAMEGAEVLIATSDKDFMQLVGDRIRLLNPSAKDGAPWGREEVVRRTGVAPEQIVDWLSLVGDSSDNIPGVPGVGAKTATALLKQFGNCDALYERLREVPSERIRASLVEAEENVRRNQGLIRLDTGVAARAPLRDLMAKPPANEELARLYRGWGFRSLLESVEKVEPQQGELL